MGFAADPAMAKARQRTNDPSDPELGGPQSADGTAAATLERDRIAMRAYEIYLARGAGEGQDLDDWLSAERELSGDRRSNRDGSDQDR
jgi:hypothetical protein